MDGGSTPPASTILGENMKEGDRVKILNRKDDSYETGVVLEVLEKSVKVKNDNISGYFIISRDLIIKE